MLYSEKSSGSRSVPTIFAWLANLLGTSPTTGFMPYEWHSRTSHAYLQNESRKDCGIYTVTHCLALAFGYGLQENGAFPSDHQRRIRARRKRYVQDLMEHGFGFYNDEEDGGGSQYYPLLDAVPSNDKSDGFLALHPDIVAALPRWAQNRRACYLDCPSKAKLVEHCARNKRFYPGYDAAAVSSKEIDLPQFLEWVEALDRKRKGGKWKPLGYPQHGPRVWIDPRHKNPQERNGKPLWERIEIIDVDVDAEEHEGVGLKDEPKQKKRHLEDVDAEEHEGVGSRDEPAQKKRRIV